MTSAATPFTYLPPDILFIIASFVDSDVQEEDDNPDSIKQSFLNLAGVCRHWRSSFLSCPSFWTKIQIPEPSVWHLEELLTRSAEYPIKVTVHYSSDYSISTKAQHLNILSTHLHRIQSLVIHRRCVDKPHDYILSLISKPVPMLEIFRYDCLRITFQNVSLAQGPIPENLFANHAPKLKEFHVSLVKLCHNLPIFKTITQLSIKNVDGLTHSQLLDMLETTSLNLEFLEISSCARYIWPSDANDPNNRPAILLPSLRTLVLNAGIQVLLLILSRTNIPCGVDGRIRFDELIPAVSLDLTPFISFLAKVRKGPYLVFEVDREQLLIQFKQTRLGPYNTTLEMIIFDVDSDDDDDDDGHLRHLESILATLELSNVLSCKLNLNTRFSLRMKMYDYVFQPLLFLLDRVEKLSFFCDYSDQLDAFVHLLWPQNAQDTITVPCPSLNDLKVGLVSGTIVGSLIQRLAARREAGHVLERLCVKYEEQLGSHTAIQDLEELAENVIMIR